jgi:uncharacterized protein with NRDE domain
MGVARDGRFALLTNYRDPSRIRTNVKSRGLLVSDFLSSRVSAREYLETVRARANEYNDFNLLAGSPEGIFNFSSMNFSGNASESGESSVSSNALAAGGPTVQEIGPGFYGMSNHLFETPWPKVIRARTGLKRALEDHSAAQANHESSAGSKLKEKLFQILADPTPAPDEDLPETGVGLEKERALSSVFITLPGYGTRCSTLLIMKPNGELEMSERTYFSDRGHSPSTVDFSLHRLKENNRK